MMNFEEDTRAAMLEMIPPPPIDPHWHDVLRRAQRGTARKRRTIALVLVVAAAAVPTLAFAGLHFLRSPITEVSGHGESRALGLAADFSATRLREFRPVGSHQTGRRFGGVRWTLHIDARPQAAVTATLRISGRKGSLLSLPLCDPCGADNHGLLSRPALWLLIALELPKKPPTQVQLRTDRGVLRFPVRR
jgi:hypothetical protein